jgi:hypothetical protein
MDKERIGRSSVYLLTSTKPTPNLFQPPALSRHRVPLPELGTEEWKRLWQKSAMPAPRGNPRLDDYTMQASKNAVRVQRSPLDLLAAILIGAAGGVWFTVLVWGLWLLVWRVMG